jgi:hypothetical protein
VRVCDWAIKAPFTDFSINANATLVLLEAIESSENKSLIYLFVPKSQHLLSHYLWLTAVIWTKSRLF